MADAAGDGIFAWLKNAGRQKQLSEKFAASLEHKKTALSTHKKSTNRGEFGDVGLYNTIFPGDSGRVSPVRIRELEMCLLFSLPGQITHRTASLLIAWVDAQNLLEFMKRFVRSARHRHSHA